MSLTMLTKCKVIRNGPKAGNGRLRSHLRYEMVMGRYYYPQGWPAHRERCLGRWAFGLALSLTVSGLAGSGHVEDFF